MSIGTLEFEKLIEEAYAKHQLQMLSSDMTTSL